MRIPTPIVVIGIILGGLAAFFVLFFAIQLTSQKISQKTFGSYQYLVENSETYWYTNSYTEKNGCIYFTNNVGQDTNYCGIFDVHANYFHTHNPSLFTAFWGVN